MVKKLTKWIDASIELPQFNVPVLCVVKNACECAHFSQTVFARVKHENAEFGYAWQDGQGDNLYHPTDVLRWRHLPKMPWGFPVGYDDSSCQ